MGEPGGEPLGRRRERDRLLGGPELRGVDLVGPHDGICEVLGRPPPPVTARERAGDQPGARRRPGVEEPGREVLALEHGPQRGRLERRRVVIEPPAHARVGAEPEIHAGVVVGVERDVVERIPVLVGHPDRLDDDLRIDHLPVERGEQRRRGRAVEAGVVEVDLEESGHVGAPSIPRCGGRGIGSTMG
ncbi:MAG: hypothetical protein KIT31_29250 [Deltaproteobacteria bacterium]|nr:hypothetical protein [Deltaproteobacteria bacterium]